MARRAKELAELAEKHRPPTAAEKAAARARAAEEAKQAEARRLADIAARKAARRAWTGQAEAPHPHNPVNRPKGWRKERATFRAGQRRHARDYDFGRQQSRRMARADWQHVCAMRRED